MPLFPAWDQKHSHEIPSGTGFYGSFVTSELWWLCQVIRQRCSSISHPSCSGLSCVTLLSPEMPRAFTGVCVRGAGWKGLVQLEDASLPIIQLRAGKKVNKTHLGQFQFQNSSLSLWPHMARLGCCQAPQEICPCRDSLQNPSELSKSRNFQWIS